MSLLLADNNDCDEPNGSFEAPDARTSAELGWWSENK